MKCARLQAAGGPCQGSSIFGCVKDAYCDSKTKSCVALKASGAACSSRIECVAGQYCDLAAMMCSTPKDVGAACTVDDECRNGFCESGKCSRDGGFTSGVCQ
jgi:hypothetical protein